MDIFIIVLGVVAAGTVGMMIRNVWVFKVRTRCLDASRWDGTNHDPYDRLPSYGEMLWRFWIWDINKFL